MATRRQRNRKGSPYWARGEPQLSALGQAMLVAKPGVEPPGGRDRRNETAVEPPTGVAPPPTVGPGLGGPQWQPSPGYSVAAGPTQMQLGGGAQAQAGGDASTRNSALSQILAAIQGLQPAQAQAPQAQSVAQGAFGMQNSALTQLLGAFRGAPLQQSPWGGGGQQQMGMGGQQFFGGGQPPFFGGGQQFYGGGGQSPWGGGQYRPAVQPPWGGGQQFFGGGGPFLRQQGQYYGGGAQGPMAPPPSPWGQGGSPFQRSLPQARQGGRSPWQFFRGGRRR